MAFLICPYCGSENPPDVETCKVCQASLVDGQSQAGLELPHDFMEINGGEISQPEGDLTDLLRSLRDDDVEVYAESEEEPLPALPLDVVDDADFNEDSEGPVLPDWLQRIRERVITEEDSVGEVTQRIKTAQDSLDDERKETQKQEFDSVIQKIQGIDDDFTDAETPREEKHASQISGKQSLDEDWLTRIRKKADPSFVEEQRKSLEDREGDSLLQWLVNLEEGEIKPGYNFDEEKPSADVEKEETQEVEINLPLKKIIQKIDSDKAPFHKRKEVELSITREEQTKADQLTAIINDENAVRPVHKREKLPLLRGLRPVMGLILLLFLSFALFLNVPSQTRNGLHDPQKAVVYDWSRQLTGEKNLLVVLNYQPGFAQEIHLVGKPILKNLVQSLDKIFVISSSPSSGLLFDKLIDEIADGKEFEINDLGFYPVESYGAFGLALQTSSNWQITSQPEFTKKLPSGQNDGILILSDNYEGAVAWIEQYSSIAPDVGIYMITTTHAAPLLQPYLESGQVQGIAAGIADAVNSDEEPIFNRVRAYQVGISVLIFTLLCGLVLPFGRTQHNESRGRK